MMVGLRRARVFVPAVTQHGYCILYRIQYQYRGRRDAVVARPGPESPTNNLKAAVMGNLIHRETRCKLFDRTISHFIGSSSTGMDRSQSVEYGVEQRVTYRGAYLETSQINYR